MRPISSLIASRAKRINQPYNMGLTLAKDSLTRCSFERERDFETSWMR